MTLVVKKINTYYIYNLLRGAAMVVMYICITDYANNKIYQKLPKLDTYFTGSDETMYLDLRACKD